MFPVSVCVCARSYTVLTVKVLTAIASWNNRITAATISLLDICIGVYCIHCLGGLGGKKTDFAFAPASWDRSFHQTPARVFLQFDWEYRAIWKTIFFILPSYPGNLLAAIYRFTSIPSTPCQRPAAENEPACEHWHIGDPKVPYLKGSEKV